MRVMGVSSWRSQTSNSLAKRSEAPARPHDLRASDTFILLLPYRPSAREKTDPFRVEACRVRENRDWNRALGFIWATVVLLGGFAITLDKTDFWFITIILLIEETRIFSRSHELEWQHQATWSITDARVSSFRALRSNSLSMMQPVRAFFGRTTVSSSDKNEEERAESRYDHQDSRRTGRQRKPTRTWTSSDVPLLTYGNWLFLSRNVSKLMYWLEILSATTCVVLSLTKLIRHDYGNVAKGDMDKRNRKSALYIFYALALAEALLFLMEKAYGNGR
ncbi:hypothetical protein SAY87_026588 [Trapa incisa]|uniref:Uncharacterized protein n=1 Tax=Trapa incisa TaxID=236973 RepID=A0AAN7JL60_9MYRT|nr:hypothetical protein SAY87_026588 [Trapa incisa]